MYSLKHALSLKARRELRIALAVKVSNMYLIEFLNLGVGDVAGVDTGVIGMRLRLEARSAKSTTLDSEDGGTPN